MQKLPPGALAGRLAVARDQRWRVEHVAEQPPCAAVELSGASASNAGRRLTLVTPFDDVRPVAGAPSARPIRPGPAVGLLAATLAGGAPWPVPSTLVTAAIDLHPHQFTASLALRTARARRVLVADPVGTGKTVQAAIAMVATLDEHHDGRVLLVVPAGLKAQWRDELRQRFGLEAHVADGCEPPAHGVEATPGPWQRPGIVLTSYDFVKRRDVLAGLDGAWWHLLVADEAHHASGPSERAEAIGAIAKRSLAVLLLTATPHDGDAARFDALTRIGAHAPEDRVLLVRRDIGGPAARRRRVHVRSVGASAAETHALDLLQRYLAALRRTRAGAPPEHPVELLATTIEKRAASSPFALARTLSRRRVLVGDEDAPRQLSLGFAPAGVDGDSDVDDVLLGLPSAMDRRQERAWLGAVIEAARRAAQASRRLAVLRALLRRIGQPAVVFTEYRDTLAWLAAGLRCVASIEVLHGGLTPGEREQALARFDRGLATVLLATDVAAEGLNLQHAARVAVLFDLPWSPARVEQRIGRVDRLGQRRRVHVWMLGGSARPERRVHERLERRGAVAEAQVGDAVSHPSMDVERDVGELERWCVRELSLRRRMLRLAPPALRWCPLTALAGDTRVAWLRPRLARAVGVRPGRALALALLTCATADGRLVERVAVPVLAELAMDPSAEVRRAVHGRAAAETASAVVSRLSATAARRRTLLADALRRGCGRDGARLEAIARELRHRVAAHFLQPGLFDQVTCAGPRSDLPPMPAAPPPAAADISVLVTVALLLLPGWQS